MLPQNSSSLQLNSISLKQKTNFNAAAEWPEFKRPSGQATISGLDNRFRGCSISTVGDSRHGWQHVPNLDSAMVSPPHRAELNAPPRLPSPQQAAERDRMARTS